MDETNSSERYQKQDRGDEAAYQAYFAGMDASVQQKVALTTAYFPTRGRIADMGCGSGRSTYDLACLYRGLELIGVDVNPVSVTHAAEHYRKDNLGYVTGDISGLVFPEDSLDGILNSSVLHHVTSFNNFDVGRISTALDNQVRELKTGGVIIIRDFVIPDGPEEVILELPSSDGSSEGTARELSTAALFRRFAATWRSSLNPDGPVAYTSIDCPRAGFARSRLSLRAAAEFILRKDYRADWEAELLEEYTYFSRIQFEEAFRTRGLRIVCSMPIWNPWIVQNRFEGRCALFDRDGNALPFPPTNYLIVGEKVGERAGVELVERRSEELPVPSFLGLRAYRDRRDGKLFELAERPNLTMDVVPWFEAAGQLFVFAKKDFPRPIVNACPGSSALAEYALSGYLTEPISAIVDPAEAGEEAVRRILSERAGIRAPDVLDILPPSTYFTSPGAVNERVESYLVRVALRPESAAVVVNYSSFTESGTIRALDARQVLRASQVGGMFDARLEINIYRLLRLLGRQAGPWIGAPISLTEQRCSSSLPADATAVLEPVRRAVFEPCDLASPHFLSLRRGLFEERDQLGRALASVSFEYVVPKSLSRKTVVALPVVSTRSGTLVGLEHRDLPAVQHFTGSSSIAVAPAWRLPSCVAHRSQLPAFLRAALRRDFGVGMHRCWELGGAYFPTPGVTPEAVYPFAVEVDVEDGSTSFLKFVALEELMARLDRVSDAHLLISACRLAHGLGRLSPR